MQHASVYLSICLLNYKLVAASFLVILLVFCEIQVNIYIQTIQVFFKSVEVFFPNQISFSIIFQIK